MKLFGPSLVLVFLAGVSYNDAQDTDFLGNATDPAFIFRVVLAFLSGRCWNFYDQAFRYPGMPNRDDYQDIQFQPANADQVLPIKTDGPLSMRGLFHLDIPDMVDEVITFFDTNEGGGLGLPLAGTPPTRRVRIMSQGNWGAPFSAENADFITGSNDLILEWIVREGTAEDPQLFDIFVDIRLPVGCFRTSTDGCGEPFQQWTAQLLNIPGVRPHPVYPDSYVWLRTSTFEGKTSSYEAIQIVDGFGNRLPAYNNWVRQASAFGIYFTKVLNTPLAQPTCGTQPPWCIVPIPLICG